MAPSLIDLLKEILTNITVMLFTLRVRFESPETVHVGVLLFKRQLPTSFAELRAKVLGRRELTSMKLQDDGQELKACHYHTDGHQAIGGTVDRASLFDICIFSFCDKSRVDVELAPKAASPAFREIQHLPLEMWQLHELAVRWKQMGCNSEAWVDWSYLAKMLKSL